MYTSIAVNSAFEVLPIAAKQQSLCPTVTTTELELPPLSPRTVHHTMRLLSRINSDEELPPCNSNEKKCRKPRFERSSYQISDPIEPVFNSKHPRHRRVDKAGIRERRMDSGKGKKDKHVKGFPGEGPVTADFRFCPTEPVENCRLPTHFHRKTPPVMRQRIGAELRIARKKAQTDEYIECYSPHGCFIPHYHETYLPGNTEDSSDDAEVVFHVDPPSPVGEQKCRPHVEKTIQRLVQEQKFVTSARVVTQAPTPLMVCEPVIPHPDQNEAILSLVNQSGEQKIRAYDVAASTRDIEPDPSGTRAYYAQKYGKQEPSEPTIEGKCVAIQGVEQPDIASVAEPTTDSATPIFVEISAGPWSWDRVVRNDILYSALNAPIDYDTVEYGVKESLPLVAGSQALVLSRSISLVEQAGYSHTDSELVYEEMIQVITTDMKFTNTSGVNTSFGTGAVSGIVNAIINSYEVKGNAMWRAEKNTGIYNNTLCRLYNIYVVLALQRRNAVPASGALPLQAAPTVATKLMRTWDRVRKGLPTDNKKLNFTGRAIDALRAVFSGGASIP